MKKIYRASLMVCVLAFVSAIMVISYSIVNAAPSANATLLADDSFGTTPAPDAVMIVQQGNDINNLCTLVNAAVLKFDLTATGVATVTNATLNMVSGGGSNGPMNMVLWGSNDDGWNENATGNLAALPSKDVNLGSVAVQNNTPDAVITFNNTAGFSNFLSAQTGHQGGNNQATIIIAPEEGTACAFGAANAQQGLDSKETARAPQVAPALVVAGLNPTAVNLVGTGATGSSNLVIVIAAVVALLSVAGFVVISRKANEAA